MSDNKDIISLNCPNCQAPLNCKSTEMTITCEHCGASVLIKDFVTKSRINKSDKLDSSTMLADNAVRNKDWKAAYKHYESICKINNTESNIGILNALGYICGRIDFNYDLISGLKATEITLRRTLISEMMKQTAQKQRTEMQSVAYLSGRNKQLYKNKVSIINQKYSPVLSALNSELRDITPVKCSCGNMVEYDEDKCSKCGKERSLIIEEARQIELGRKKANRFAIVAAFTFVISVLFGSSSIAYIRIGDYSTASKQAVISLLLFAVFLFVLNSKLKNFLLSQLSEKISVFDKFRDKVNKIYLPFTVVVPLVCMLFLGMCMNAENRKPEESITAAEQITETTEPETKEAVILTESETEPPTEEPTEAETEPSTEEETEAEVTEPDLKVYEYVINYNTNVFHRPNCHTIKDSANTGEYMGQAEELEQQGYKPCGVCKP